MTAISKPIFSLYPATHFGEDYPQMIHDPKKDLYNPNPYDNWKSGETCWYYNRKDSRAYYAVVTDVDEPTLTSGKKLFVCLLGDDDVGHAMLDAKEAFKSLKDLVLAFYTPCAEIKTSEG